MYVHRQASSVMVRAPAKLNLFFEVLSRRDDGYHEVETVVVPLGLYDTLIARPAPRGELVLDCRWQGAAEAEARVGLPPIRENLAFRAVELLARRAGVDEGISLALFKRIPSEAGLGGASSDAAAALLAANDLWKLGWSRAALQSLGGELGSDVPLFLEQGAVLCRGRGEQVEPIGAAAPLHFVVVKPPAGLSTAKVYAEVEVPQQPRSASPLVAKLRAGELRGLSACMYNRLQGAAEKLSEWIGRLAREFRREGCLADQMSGSGTAYFGVCHHARQARRVAMRLQARNLGRVYAVGAAN
jgi:4-diphosphocytidyl-2-C-methyl-D-erythritol kinase